MAEQADPDFVRDLSTGGQLDNKKLKRIDQNPFIVNDGTLPSLRVTRTYLNTFETKSTSQQDNPLCTQLQALNDKPHDCEVYLVELTVISGHGLTTKDVGGKCDPFVKIAIGSAKARTKVIENNSNPVFNETFSFQFLNNPKTIAFDVVTSQDEIGTAVFHLTDAFNARRIKPFEAHLKLKRNKKKKVKGATIKIRVIAQRLLPLTLQKIAEQQQETIFKQNQQIESLTKENALIRRLNAALKRVHADMNASRAMGQPRSDSAPSLSPPAHVPTMVHHASSKDAVFEYMTMVMTQLYSAWQIILRRCVYGVPWIGYYVDLLILFMGSLLRLHVGYHVFQGATTSERPRKILKLYEFEGNAECKMVREMLSALDLDCNVYPSPPLSGFRDEAKVYSGKADGIPLLVDENMGDDGPLVLVGGAPIVRYLTDAYGDNVKKTYFERVQYGIAHHRWSLFVYQWCYLNLLRNLGEQGRERMENTVKAKLPLEIYGYEASPFCSKVREVLCSMEIPYVVRNIAYGSQQKRQIFQIRFGKKYSKWRQRLKYIQVPLLIDPNTEEDIFESEHIKQYLIETYSAV